MSRHERGGVAVALLLALAVLAGPRPAGAQPTAQLTLSGNQFRGGEPFTLGFSVNNTGGSAADVHVGVILPGAVSFFSFGSGGTLVGPFHSVSQLTPVESAPTGFSDSRPAFFSTTIPTAGIPLGTYLFFAALVRAGTLLDNAVNDGDLLALDVKTMLYGSSPLIDGCPVFPPDNAWNTDISAFPVHPNSANLIASIGVGGHLHPDFGTIYGIPFVTVPGTTPKVFVNFVAYPEESDLGPYPLPPDAPIEGGSDAHVLVIDRDACILYELFNADFTGGQWSADSGAIWPLLINATRPVGFTSADAAGLPIFPGLVRLEEVLAGEIRHALRFTVSQTRHGWIFPASHEAGSTDNPNVPPMGLRLRLRADFPVSAFDPRNQVILRALQRYGMIVADNGSNWFISGALNPAWNDDVLDELKQVPGSAFEVVYTGEVVVPAP